MHKEAGKFAGLPGELGKESGGSLSGAVGSPPSAGNTPPGARNSLKGAGSSQKSAKGKQPGAKGRSQGVKGKSQGVKGKPRGALKKPSSAGNDPPGAEGLPPGALGSQPSKQLGKDSGGQPMHENIDPNVNAEEPFNYKDNSDMTYPDDPFKDIPIHPIINPPDLRGSGGGNPCMKCNPKYPGKPPVAPPAGPIPPDLLGLVPIMPEIAEDGNSEGEPPDSGKRPYIKIVSR